MSPEHSSEAVLTLRRLVAGAGGGVLVVTGEVAPYYAGVHRPPTRTLLEAILTLTADSTYQRVAVFTGTGQHLPPVQVGERLVVGRMAAGWLALGQMRPAPAAASSPSARADDDDDADYDRHFHERLAAGPADRILFHSQNPDWAAQLSTVLQKVEQLCGVSWNGNLQVPIPGVTSPRTLILLDEALFRPTPVQVSAVVTGTVRTPAEAERTGLEARFRALPRLIQKTLVDTVLFAQSASIGESLRKGTLAREEVPDVPTCQPELFPELRWEGVDELKIPSGQHGQYLKKQGEGLSPYDAFRILPPSSPHTAMQELNAMIGLVSVKEQVARLMDRAWENARRQQLGLATEGFELHTIFYGNPGTGKSDVAQILAQIFVELGLLSGSKLTRVTPGDLIADIVGGTAPKTTHVLRDALGGVLFIDEAYGLMPRHGNSFAGECVEAMLPWLTERRRELAVILAGYPGQMEEMLKVNAGLKDRFQRHLSFPDYTDDELVKIAHEMARRSGDELASGCDNHIRSKLQQHRLASGSHFSNARAVKNLLGWAREIRAQRLRRLTNPSVDDFRRFLPGDFLPAEMANSPQTP